MLLEFNLKPIFIPEIRFAGQEVLTNFKKEKKKPFDFQISSYRENFSFLLL